MAKEDGGTTGRVTGRVTSKGTFSASKLEGVIVERFVRITGRREQRHDESRRD